jgi:uncharacterized RDD family membrane protein YckC
VTETDPPVEPLADDSGPSRHVVLGTVFRVGSATGHLALLPFRAAARTPLVRERAERLAETGREVGTDVRERLEQAAVGALETPEAERTIDRALAGPLPETIARSAVQHRVLQRVIAEMLATADRTATITPASEEEDTEQLVRQALSSPALERLLADVAESTLMVELTDQVTRSPAFHRALRNVLSSPEMRAALTEQTTGFAGEIRDAVRRRAMRVDETAGRRPREAGVYAGLATRGIAFVVDVLLIHLVFLLGAALVALVGSLFGKLRPEWLVGTLVGSGWLIVVTVYFVLFWSTTGQTPGMRLMQLRVARGAGRRLGVVRSVVRLVGLALAIIPLFVGFLPVLFDRRRRALQDFLAGTVVFYEIDGGSPARDDAPGVESQDAPPQRLEIEPNPDERTVVDGRE